MPQRLEKLSFIRSCPPREVSETSKTRQVKGTERNETKGEKMGDRKRTTEKSLSSSMNRKQSVNNAKQEEPFVAPSRGQMRRVSVCLITANRHFSFLL